MKSVRIVAIARDAQETRRALGYGLLGGMLASEILKSTLPFGSFGVSQALRIELHFLIGWCLIGLTIASIVVIVERRFGALPWLPFLVISALLMPLVWAILPTPAGGVPWDDSARFSVSAWGGVVFGAAFRLAQRLGDESERSRRLFMQAEIGRQRTEALLGAERMRALQGQVDPSLLLRAMVEVERRYASDATAMARLLDLLVGFLRAAMPGVRSGASTLAAELLLAQQYAALQAELDPGGAGWRIRDLSTLPELPFPALLLLPVLDQLVAGNGAAEPDAELDITRDETSCTLRLSRAAAGRGPWLTPELLYRLQVGLRAVLGDAWTLVVNERPAPNALVLSLPLTREAPTGVAGPPVPSSNPLETLHG